MATITTSVELKQPICFIDGVTMNSVAGGAVHSVNEWDDISSDVLASKMFSYDRGIRGNSPTSLVASPGKLDMSLNNTAYNSGSKAGYYSPDHSNIRGGFEQGTEVRVKHVYSTSTGYGWRGKIFDIEPTASPYGAYTKVTSFDWMRQAQDQKFQAVTVDTDQRGDQALATMIAILPHSRQPEAVDYDAGKSTYPYVFDSERDEKTSVMSVLQKVAQSELGRIYVNSQAGDGEQLVFENRHHPIDETTVQYDFDDDVVSVDVTYPFDYVHTKVICRAYPRRVDTGDVVLGKIQKSFSVPAGETRVVKILFRDPNSSERISASSLTAMASGTDYIANASEDGGGADRTADLTVTTNEESGNSISLNVSNGGAGALWVTTLQQQGKGIYLYDPVTYESSANPTYIAEKGEADLRYDLPYEDDYNVAVDFGDYLLNTWKDPICQIDGLSYYPNESTDLADAFMDIDLGHRITINFTQLGIDQDYFVRSKTVFWDRGLLKCSYGVQPAGSSTFMQLGDAIYGKLDEPECRLAF